MPMALPHNQSSYQGYETAQQQLLIATDKLEMARQGEEKSRSDLIIATQPSSLLRLKVKHLSMD